MFQEISDHLSGNRDWLGGAVMGEAYHILNGLGHQVDVAFDMVFSAGTLSSGLVGLEGESVPTIESEQYHSSLTENKQKQALRRARSKLVVAIQQFKRLDKLDYPDQLDPGYFNGAFKHWLKNNSHLQDLAVNFFSEVRDKIKQSLEKRFGNTKTGCLFSRGSVGRSQ